MFNVKFDIVSVKNFRVLKTYRINDLDTIANIYDRIAPLTLRSEMKPSNLQRAQPAAIFLEKLTR